MNFVAGGPCHLVEKKLSVGDFKLTLRSVLLRNCTGAIDIKLTEEEIEYIEEPYQPMAIFGHS